MKSTNTRFVTILASTLAVAGWTGIASGNAISFDINSITPDGRYYVYSTASTSELGIQGYVYDVDSYGNYIYANIGGGQIARWTVGLSGGTNPNLHPDNPSATGPMVSRTFTDLRIYNTGIGSQSHREIHATADALYYRSGGGWGTTDGSLIRYDLATGMTSTVIDGGVGSLLAYDDANDIWYMGEEDRRAAYRWDGSGWSLAFTYSNMAGSHMDGMEFVNGSMFVSDMTSDYLLQATQNARGDWELTNLFQYNDPTATVVEGMGFGAFDHFWIGAGDRLVEIGGGELQQVVTTPEPATLALMGLGLVGMGFSLRHHRS